MLRPDAPCLFARGYGAGFLLLISQARAVNFAFFKRGNITGKDYSGLKSCLSHIDLPIIFLLTKILLHSLCQLLKINDSERSELWRCVNLRFMQNKGP